LTKNVLKWRPDVLQTIGTTFKGVGGDGKAGVDKNEWIMTLQFTPSSQVSTTFVSDYTLLVRHIYLWIEIKLNMICVTRGLIICPWNKIEIVTT